METTSNAPSGHLSPEVVQDIAEAAMASKEEAAAAQEANSAPRSPEGSGSPDAPPPAEGAILPGESLSGDAVRGPRDGGRDTPRGNRNDQRPPRDPQAQQQAAQQRREAEQARREAEQQRREQERARREEDQRRRQAEQARRESADRALLPIDDLCGKAWQIFLAEVGEEGVELFPDNEARELTRRSFRLAEIFMQEELRVRRPPPPPQREPRESRQNQNGPDASEKTEASGNGAQDTPQAEAGTAPETSPGPEAAAPKASQEPADPAETP